MAKMYIVRHGETDWNRDRIFQGRTDIPLNDMGREQARDTAEKLKDIRFDAVYCSPLVRARETCEIILNNNEHDGKIIFDKRIIERNFGIYEGIAIKDINLPTGSWWNEKDELFMKNGETLTDMFNRVRGFLDHINKNYSGKNKNILVVAHGGIGIIVNACLGSRPADGDLFKAYKMDNCSVVEYEI